MGVHRLELTLSDEQWERLNVARGHEPRASFVKRALDRAVAPVPLESLGPSPSLGRVRASAGAAKKVAVALEVRDAVQARDAAGRVGWCPHGRCSLSGPLGDACPDHLNLRFKPRQ